MELLAQPISGGKIGSAPPRDLSKAGYVRLALYKFGPNTPLQHFKNAYHLVCYSHIIQKVNIEGSSAKDLAEPRIGCDKSFEYVAYHHFPSEYLEPDGSGPKTMIITAKQARKLNISESDRVQIKGHSCNRKYILPPCRKWNETSSEFLPAGGKLESLTAATKTGENIDPQPSSQRLGLPIYTRSNPFHRTPAVAQTDPKVRATERLKKTLFEACPPREDFEINLLSGGYSIRTSTSQLRCFDPYWHLA